MDIIFFILMILAIVAATEPARRRTAHLPRAPFGSDAEDRDLLRVLHDTRSEGATSRRESVVTTSPAQRSTRAGTTSAAVCRPAAP
jgi:hypothetical protein